MPRTKKFLTSSTARTGFYRPVKRTAASKTLLSPSIPPTRASLPKFSKVNVSVASTPQEQRFIRSTAKFSSKPRPEVSNESQIAELKSMIQTEHHRLMKTLTIVIVIFTVMLGLIVSILWYSLR